MRDFSWWYFNVLNELKVPHASSSLGGANTSLNSFKHFVNKKWHHHAKSLMKVLPHTISWFGGATVP